MNKSELRLVCALIARSVQALLVTAICFSTNAAAAEIPDFDKPISMAAREQPVHNFFAELFGHLGVPVKVDAGIVGSVNGDFQGTAREVYRDVEKAFQLTMYYDSSKVYIYSSDQLSRKIIPMSEKIGKMVLRNAKKMGVGDSLNKAVWSDMGLVVTGTDRYRTQIESYTQALRSRTSTPTAQAALPAAEVIKVFKLKYAWADDTTIVSGGQELLVRGVATLLRTVVESGMVGVEQSSGTQRSRLPRTEQGLRGRGLQSVGRDSSGNLSNSAESPDQSMGTNRTSQYTLSANASSDMGHTRIVADPLNNAVIIRDRPDRMQNYQDLIDSLDIQPKMVEIEATIIDMDTDRLRSLGIDWRLQSDEAQVLFGSAAATNGLLNSNSSAITNGLTGFTQNVLNSKAQFLSRIRALEEQSAARIVSKPHVMTLANVEALLDTTSTFFIRVAGREEVDLFNVSVGTTMRVTPHVFDQGGRSQIKLKIDIVDGNQALQTVDGIPVIDESTINTQAIINAGQSLLIGGLVRELKTTGVTKVPLLGSIPVLGALFRNTSKNTSRVERMFLITPRIHSQAPAGKRYSVPILSGTEAQILESGPSRIEPTLAGLASRDAAFPLQQKLPMGNAHVELNVPNQALPDALPQQNLEVPAQDGVSGDRSNIPDAMLVAAPSAEEIINTPIQVEPKTSPPQQINADSGWQVVSRTKPAEIVASGPQVLPAAVEEQFAPVKSKVRDEATDNWTEIPTIGFQKTAINDDDWTEIK